MILDDTPCRITSTPFIEGGLFLVAINIPLQIPALVHWSVIALRERRKRKRQQAAPRQVKHIDDIGEKFWGGKDDEKSGND